MNNSCVKLPDNWIRRESKNRPSHFYFFNTKTGMSQWTAPLADNQIKRSSKLKPVESLKHDGKSVQNRLKISSQSVEIKKNKSKTPAQHRLKNLIKKLEVDSGSLKDPIESHKKNIRKTDSNRNSKNEHSDRNISSKSLVKTCGTTYRSEPNANINEVNLILPTERKKSDLNRTGTNKHFDRKISSKSLVDPGPVETSGKILTTEEIPILFLPKTPGQDRLNRLRISLNPPNEPESFNKNNTQIALNVIRNGFGMSDKNNENVAHSSTIDNDEAMDWEPSDIFESVENKVYNGLTDLSYIVPDTNVFLDGISCIRDTIQRDKKCNILVPFVVLQELDRLKSRQGDSRISCLASAAIKFIYNQLKSKNQRLQGQKATEDNRHIIDVSCADDKILNCCLQMKEQSREAVLVTNDMNLSNKAIASGIESMTSKECQAKLIRSKIV